MSLVSTETPGKFSGARCFAGATGAGKSLLRMSLEVEITVIVVDTGDEMFS